MKSKRAEQTVDEEAALNASARQPVVVAMVAVLVAAAAATALVAVGVKNGEDSKNFSRGTEYVTWSIFTIGLVVLSAVGAVYCLPGWLYMHRRSPRPARLASYGVVMLITLCYDASPAVGGRLFLGVGKSDLDHSNCREVGLGVLVGLFSFLAASGLVMGALLLSRAQPPMGSGGSRLAITQLLWIRGSCNVPDGIGRGHRRQRSGRRDVSACDA